MSCRWFYITLQWTPGDGLRDARLGRHLQRCRECRKIVSFIPSGEMVSAERTGNGQDDLWPAIRERILQWERRSSAIPASRRTTRLHPLWLAGAGLTAALVLLVALAVHRSSPSPTSVTRRSETGILVHQVRMEGKRAMEYFYKPENDRDRLYLWVQSEGKDG